MVELSELEASALFEFDEETPIGVVNMQRRFGVGYTRACELIDVLRRNGLIQAYPSIPYKYFITPAGRAWLAAKEKQDAGNA